MDDATLRADCSACIGLCCVLLAFDAGDSFAFDKPAHVACRHLAANDACTIHDTLEAQGMSGCAAYDCYGAGQAVTRIFGSHHWRDAPSTLRLMAELFRRVREANRWISMMQQAGFADLVEYPEDRYPTLRNSTDTSPLCQWHLASRLRRVGRCQLTSMSKD